MRKPFIFLLIIFFALTLSAQNPRRPKLVVGVVVDQMRWDYLYRYYDRYAENGGFKKMLNKGFTCENTFIPYVPTITACGHSSIYTGSVPAINGIVGNNWYDNLLNKNFYCTEDSSVKTVGSNTALGLESPRNLLTTTISDELRLATNFRSKVIGIALKDRASILPAGHSANAAYWYDNKTGDWITSSYYMNELPQWVKDFNMQNLVNKYYTEGWKTLYPLNTYLQSTADENNFENKPFGIEAKGFPYNLGAFSGSDYSKILTTPFGNTLTAELAKASVTNEQLGADSITDFLAISFSSTDYVGHAFGPNSVEAEDTYLRLDKNLGDLFNFLDNKVGKGQYLAFLSADHGAAHATSFAKEHKIPSGNIHLGEVAAKMNKLLKEKFGKDSLVLDILNYQVYLNLRLIESSALRINEIKTWIINYLSAQEGIASAVDMNDFSNMPLNEELRGLIANGYYPGRSGQIQLILQPQWFEGGSTGTTHGSWNPYDSHIPLVWYGWGVKPGRTNKELYMTDIAPTIAAMLHIQAPNGSIGHVIEEIIK